jgi:hypothetical protein
MSPLWVAWVFDTGAVMLMAALGWHTRNLYRWSESLDRHMKAIDRQVEYLKAWETELRKREGRQG